MYLYLEKKSFIWTWKLTKNEIKLKYIKEIYKWNVINWEK